MGKENEPMSSEISDREMSVAFPTIIIILIIGTCLFLGNFLLAGYAIGCLILGFIGKEIARNRKMSGDSAFLLCALLGILGIIIVLLSEKKPDAEYKERMLETLSDKMNNTSIDQLLKLSELKEKGLISQEEFETFKAKLL